MARKRTKKPTIPLLTALLVIVLTVCAVALLMTALLSMHDSDKPEVPTTAATTQSVPVPDTSDTTDFDVTTDSVVTTDKLPETVTTPSVSPSTTPQSTVTEKPATTPKPVTTTPPVTTPPVTTLPTPEYEYHVDMSKFESAIDPTGDLWSDDYLLLVNVNHPMVKNAEMSSETLKKQTQLSKAGDYRYSVKPQIYLNSTALKALCAMLLQAEAQGITTLDVTSAYRDYDYQSSVFNSNCNRTKHWVCDDDSCNVDWIGQSSTCPICGKKTSKTVAITREEQEANVATYSCAPGTSDHQTGLAVDIVQRSLGKPYSDLIQEFGDTEAGKWLAENAHHFGFVLRFPPDKEDITGIIYEPWHFRYVGRTHATAMYELNLCLEEYVEYLDSIGYFN